MYGVIDYESKTLIIYFELAPAITLFFQINKEKEDVRILSHLNESLFFLSSQDYLYCIENLETYNLASRTIINIAIIGDEELNCRLGSVLLRLDSNNISSLKNVVNANRNLKFQNRMKIFIITL